MATDIIARGMAADAVNQMKEKFGQAYKVGGSRAFSALPSPSAEYEGYIYNITEDFVTNNLFIEGAGVGYPTGTNVGIITESGNYYYDVFNAMMDIGSVPTGAIEALFD